MQQAEDIVEGMNARLKESQMERSELGSVITWEREKESLRS